MLLNDEKINQYFDCILMIVIEKDRKINKYNRLIVLN